MVHLDYRDVRPIYTQIADGFRAQIKAGVLRGEDRLPSVRELAAELSINPNTIQRAYRQLEAEGWIATVPGKGCFVCDNETTREKEWQRFEQICKRSKLIILDIIILNYEKCNNAKRKCYTVICCRRS